MNRVWAVAVLTVASVTGLGYVLPHQQPGTDAGMVPGDAARGKMLFEKRCTGCHAMDAEREGPRLAGVYGRKAGSVPGFNYSQGLKNSGLIWNDVTLDKWLSGPEQVVPDTRMDFYVPKAAERSDLIAFFKAR